MLLKFYLRNVRKSNATDAIQADISTLYFEEIKNSFLGSGFTDRDYITNIA